MAERRWICIDISIRYNRPKLYGKITETLSELFDGAEVIIPGDFMDDVNFSNDLVSYVFVQCDNVYKYRDAIKSCKYIGQVLRTVDDLTYLAEQEVRGTVKLWNTKKEESKNSYSYGELVKVNAGIYSSMFGIVVGKADSESYIVVIKLVDEYHLTVLMAANCEKTGHNIFDRIRVPAE